MGAQASTGHDLKRAVASPSAASAPNKNDSDMTNSDHRSNDHDRSPTQARAKRKPVHVASAGTSCPKIDFTDQQIQTILNHVRGRVEASVRGTDSPLALPQELDNATSFGLFVTLRRPTLLRACRGRWGDTTKTLGELLNQVTGDTATLDPRFPSIVTEELPFLAIDVSLMYDPIQVCATGNQRITAVEVGTHGIVIDHPRGRGLLLPQVATEAGWDAKTFLDHLALKAGLPVDTWRQDPEARLMTFRARRLTSDAPRSEIDIQQWPTDQAQQWLALVNQILQGQRLPAPTDGPLSERHEHHAGIHLQTPLGATATSFGTGHSLWTLTEAAVRSMKELRVSRPKEQPPEPISCLTLLWQPIRLEPADYPHRHGLLAQSAVRIRHGGRWQLILPDPGRRSHTVDLALTSMQMTGRDWQLQSPLDAAQLTAFAVTHIRASDLSNHRPTRKPARHGQFYPAEPDTMNRQIDTHLATGSPGRAKANCRAVMLPHAGWQYCGDTIGLTLSRVNVPETVILIGPKHTPLGPIWSVSSDQCWEIPGATVPIATDLVRRLTRWIRQLDCEPEAHRLEHGSEVLLPFLMRVQPRLRAVPIVMGQTSYDTAVAMADGLAKLIDEMETTPLLVISSDMNHFATEPENRRLDHLALEAMLTGQPRRLYDTCADNQISMCGLLPAVTVMQTLAKSQPLQLELVDYRNSAAVTGDDTSVVGYAGVLIR